MRDEYYRQKYLAEHGDLEIPLNYKTENGIWLGSWLYRQRQYRRTGDPRLGEMHRRELDELLKTAEELDMELIFSHK